MKENLRYKMLNNKMATKKRLLKMRSKIELYKFNTFAMSKENLKEFSRCSCCKIPTVTLSDFYVFKNRNSGTKVISCKDCFSKTRSIILSLLGQSELELAVMSS